MHTENCENFIGNHHHLYDIHIGACLDKLHRFPYAYHHIDSITPEYHRVSLTPCTTSMPILTFTHDPIHISPPSPILEDLDIQKSPDISVTPLPDISEEKIPKGIGYMVIALQMGMLASAGYLTLF